MITDGNGVYIKHMSNGNYVPVRRKCDGDTWSSETKATNVIMSCLNRNLRDRYHVIPVKDDEVSVKLTAKTTKAVVNMDNELVKQIGSQEIDSSGLDDLIEKLNDITAFASEIDTRQTKLWESCSEIDKEITDIQHYIEFGTFNAYQGWLAFNMLRNRLKQRRKIKDELIILQKLKESGVGVKLNKQIKSSIDYLDHKAYKPRVLVELFE